MMRFRNTILAFLVLAGLGAFIYYYEYKGEAAREAQEASGRNALSFEREQVRGLRIVRPQMEPLLLSRRTEGWMLESPIQARADDEKVASLLGGLGFLRIERKLEGVTGDELGEFKLGDQAVRVVLTIGEGAEELTLDLGDKVPIGNERYARRSEGADVLLVSGDTAGILSADATSLRYRKLVGIESWKVAGFRIENRTETVQFERGTGGEQWLLEKPISFPADSSKVQGLWLELQSAEADGFETENAAPADLKRLGLEPASLTVTVSPMSGGGEGADPGSTPPEKPPVRLTLSSPTPDGIVYARREGLPAVMKVPGTIYEKLNNVLTDLSAYRDHRAAPVDRWKLSSIELRRPSGPLKLIRNPDDSGWHMQTAEGPLVPAEQANALIDALEAIKATGYVDGESAGASLSGPPPLLSVTLSERADQADRSVSMTIHAQGSTESNQSALRRVTSTASSAVYLVPGVAVQSLIDQAAALSLPPTQTGPTSTPDTPDGETDHP